MVKIIILFVVFLFLLFCLFWIRTFILMQGQNQKVFSKGTLPGNLEGFYKGSVGFYHGSWIGKSFNSKTKTGVNIFEKNGKIKEAFRFVTYIGKGILDPNLNVLKIDYNIAGNSIFLRMVLDELVEISPGRYLGKAHIRLPLITFTVAYFNLQK